MPKEEFINTFAVENTNNDLGVTVRVIECKTDAIAKIICDSANEEFRRSKRNCTSRIVRI